MEPLTKYTTNNILSAKSLSENEESTNINSVEESISVGTNGSKSQPSQSASASVSSSTETRIAFGQWTPFVIDSLHHPEFIQSVSTIPDAVAFALRQKIQQLYTASRSRFVALNPIDIGLGDILYHPWFAFGHSSIARSFTQNADTGELYQHITDCGANVFSASDCVNQSLVYNPAKYSGSVTRIRFVGGESPEEAQFFRFAVAILADYLGMTNHIFHSGQRGYCSYLKTSCYGIELLTNAEQRRQSIAQTVERFYSSLFSSNLFAEFICSTMAIILWQMVFRLFKPEYVALYLSLNAEGCLPKDINTLAAKYPKVWQAKTIAKGFNTRLDDNRHFPFDGNIGIAIAPDTNEIGGRSLQYLLPEIRSSEELLHNRETRSYSRRELLTELISASSTITNAIATAGAKTGSNLTVGTATWYPYEPRPSNLLVWVQPGKNAEYSQYFYVSDLGTGAQLIPYAGDLPLHFIGLSNIQSQAVFQQMHGEESEYSITSSTALEPYSGAEGDNDEQREESFAEEQLPYTSEQEEDVMLRD
jgi:hypothetical protein